MFWLCAKPEIRDVKALKGKRVGVSGIGSGPDSLLREMLRQNGLDPVRDIAILSLGVMPTIFSGLQSGTVDAAILSPMTQDGTLNQETQAKAVEHVLRRLEIKEAPPLAKIFDFTLTRKVIADLQTKGWKP